MYEGIALFYDTFTDDIDYARLAAFVRREIKASRAWRDYSARGERPILLDAACGTGRLTALMRDEFDCIGLDVSSAMLDAARRSVSDPGVLWICQDMCSMDLFGTVTAIVSATDSVNHITSAKKLGAFFGRAHNFLDPGGLLIFDVLTEQRFVGPEAAAGMDYFADFETESCFWHGKYNKNTKICTYYISCFRLTDAEHNIYERSDDIVREKVWAPEELKTMLAAAGFVSVRVLPGGTKGAPGGRTGRDRLYFICEKEHA